MSYNGIGLSTPRGSGTNGYVQRNLSHIRKRPEPYSRDKQLEEAKAPKAAQRKPDKEILEHERKRKVELRVLELRDKLEEEGTLGEDEIDDKCDSLRAKLLARLANGELDDEEETGSNTRRTIKSHKVHEIAQKKIEELGRIRYALDLPETVEPDAGA